MTRFKMMLAAIGSIVGVLNGEIEYRNQTVSVESINIIFF